MPSPRSMPSASVDDWADRRVLVVVAHPDDEVLGCGALLATLGDVEIVHVTDGAPRNNTDGARQGFEDPTAYAQTRRAEALAALALVGIAADRLISLGIPDQEASLHLPVIVRRIEPLIAQADVVLTHAFEGGHSDHDAVAFAVRAALGLSGGAAKLFEMPFYHGDDTGWVRQRFPADPNAMSYEPHVTRTLSPAERTLKATMMAAHATQWDTLADFSLAAEQFRCAPDHDFTRRPHAGPLLYERHGWNLTWETWMERVASARSSLGIAPS